MLFFDKILSIDQNILIKVKLNLNRPKFEKTKFAYKMRIISLNEVKLGMMCIL